MSGVLGTRCFRGVADAELGSRVSQEFLNPHCDRVRAAENAPRGPCRVLENIHGLAEIANLGGGVRAKCPRISMELALRGDDERGRHSCDFSGRHEPTV